MRGCSSIPGGLSVVAFPCDARARPADEPFHATPHHRTSTCPDISRSFDVCAVYDSTPGIGEMQTRCHVLHAYLPQDPWQY